MKYCILLFDISYTHKKKFIHGPPKYKFLAPPLSKPKMTTSATHGLGKNCPHNKRLTKLVVLYHHWSSLIWHEEEDFPSNMGLSKPKMITSATLGLGKNCPHSNK